MARSLHRFRGDEDEFRHYVFAIARRRLIDHRRKAARRRTQPAPADRIEPHLPTGDVEAEAMDTFSAEAAMALLSRSLGTEAEVVMLRVVAGFTSRRWAASSASERGPSGSSSTEPCQSWPPSWPGRV